MVSSWCINVQLERVLISLNVLEDQKSIVPQAEEVIGAPINRKDLKQHKFSPEIKERVQKLCHLDNYNGLLFVLEDWLVMACSILVSAIVTAYFPKTLFSTATYGLAVLVMGSRMRGLAGILHQSTHGTMAKDRKLNLFIGTALSGWTILQSWTGYFRNHVVEHHAFLGDPDRDPDFVQIRTSTKLYEPNTTRSDVINYLLSIPGPAYTLTYIYYLATIYIIPEAESKIETIFRSTYWFTMLAIFYHFGLLQSFMFYWMVPLLTTCTWTAALIEFAEHYPLLRESMQKKGDLYITRNRVCSWLEDFFTGWHNEGYHLTHHLFPRLPGWNLRKAHYILLEDAEYKMAHYKRPGWIGIIEEILGYFDK